MDGQSSSGSMIAGHVLGDSIPTSLVAVRAHWQVRSQPGRLTALTGATLSFRTPAGLSQSAPVFGTASWMRPPAFRLTSPPGLPARIRIISTFLGTAGSVSDSRTPCDRSSAKSPDQPSAADEASSGDVGENPLVPGPSKSMIHGQSVTHMKSLSPPGLSTGAGIVSPGMA